MTLLYFGEKKNKEKRKEKKIIYQSSITALLWHSPHHQKNHVGLLMTPL
jgi:hypothetical protein